MEKKEIKLENGTFANAFAPVIVSASRSTDIPAFYADCFFSSIECGIFRLDKPVQWRKKQCVLSRHPIYCVLVKDPTSVITDVVAQS